MTAAVHDALLDAGTRRIVAAIVRRWVPARDVEDVVQSVFCEALAAGGAPPDDAVDVRRWLTGIARHKAVDYHRRRGRENVVLGASEDVETQAPPYEAREALDRVMEHARDSRARQTLEWLVREHEGEALSAIAARERIAPTAVRQRVSRMRRALRRDLAWALVGTFVLASGAIAVWRRPWSATSSAPASSSSIRGDVSEGALAPEWMRGEFVAVDVTDPALAAQGEGARVRVETDRVVVDTAAAHGTRALRVVRSHGANDEKDAIVDVVEPNGAIRAEVDVTLDARGDLVVRRVGDPARGSVLRRAR